MATLIETAVVTVYAWISVLAGESPVICQSDYGYLQLSPENRKLRKKVVKVPEEHRWVAEAKKGWLIGRLFNGAGDLYWTKLLKFSRGNGHYTYSVRLVHKDEKRGFKDIIALEMDTYKGQTADYYIRLGLIPLDGDETADREFSVESGVYNSRDSLNRAVDELIQVYAMRGNNASFPIPLGLWQAVDELPHKWHHLPLMYGGDRDGEEILGLE